MKILFIVTGVGYGDATREHANIETFMKKHPATEVMIAGYDNSYKYFKDKYPTIEIKGYKFTEQSLKFSVPRFIWKNYNLPFFWAVNTLRLRKRVKEFNPDIIISDFEPIGIILAKLVKKKCVMIFGYDPELFKQCPYKNKKTKLEAKYFNTLYKSADAVIIPRLLGEKTDSKYHSVNPILRTKPQDIQPKEELMKKLELEKEPIVIMLGGSTFGNILAKKIIHFSHLFREDFIIFGSKIGEVTQKNVTYYPYKENVMEYMKVSKAVITLAGHLTLSECLALKKPAMVFPIKDHAEQILNAYMLENIFYIRYDLKDLRKNIKKFLSKLDAIKGKIPSIEFNGAEQVTDIIYELSNY
ncbi:MAG: hypothetical protein ISS23_03360 [Nanoarchaeota archaeon]|nr:hypothetical protein [Nanoarchaeota archaeon]